MTYSNRVLIFTTLVMVILSAECSFRSRRPGLRHFIYFGLERHLIEEKDFLDTESIFGAQLKFTWRELEPEREQYDFSQLSEPLTFLEQYQKRLFVQIQDVSFDEKIINVPDYLCEDPAFNGGVALKYEFEDNDESKPISDGWVARRWDPAVIDRFSRLLFELGRKFDGRVEGINLSETSIGFGESGKLHPEDFSHEAYVEGVKMQMDALREAFPRSSVILYANFMSGEWLPWDDHGYLRSVYAYADSIGVGVGGPDLLPYRKGQLNHSYPLIAARGQGVVAGVAVQWGNLEDLNPETGERVTVSELVRFAEQELHLDYIFWGGEQEPYYSEEILPYLRGLNQ